MKTEEKNIALTRLAELQDLKALLEIRQGRRPVTQDPMGSQAICELTTPTLTTLEWALPSEKLELPEAALAKMQELVEAPTKPSERLRAAAKRHGR